MISADLDLFRARELLPFTAVVRAGVRGVLTSHVVLAALEPEPAPLSRRLLVDLSAGELGFRGASSPTRWTWRRFANLNGLAGAAVRALAACADLMLLGTLAAEESFIGARQALDQAVRHGRIPPERVHEATAPPGRVLGTAAGRPVIVAVRDAYRVPWQRKGATGLLRQRPDVVQAALGMPDDEALVLAAAGTQARWAVRVSASRVSTRALAETLIFG